MAVISIFLLRVSFTYWKSISYKNHAHTKVVVVLQFSAIQSPFSKYFDLKDFLIFARNLIICCFATQHAQVHSTIQSVSMCVLLMWENKWWKIFAGKKPTNILTCDIAIVRYSV